MLARFYGDPALVEMRQLPVDAYAVQHPATNGRVAAQSLALHLMTLCLFVEHGVAPSRGPELHKQMVADRPSFPVLGAPPQGGALTLADVPLDEDEDVLRAALWRWAAAAWEAWAEHHATVSGWLERAGCAVPHGRKAR